MTQWSTKTHAYPQLRLTEQWSSGILQGRKNCFTDPNEHQFLSKSQEIISLIDLYYICRDLKERAYINKRKISKYPCTNSETWIDMVILGLKQEVETMHEKMPLITLQKDEKDLNR